MRVLFRCFLLLLWACLQPVSASAQTPACDALSRSHDAPDSETVGSRHEDLARAIDDLRRLGECLSQALDYGAEQLERSLPLLEQELTRLERDLHEQLPILRERLEALQRRLEEALKNAPEDRERPREKGRRAIAV
jgi:small-conductance mechanosensitive channel